MADLQSMVSAATIGTGSEVIPHHPLTCSSKLYYHEDGSLECEHARTPANDRRTQAGIVHSLAILLIELGYEL